MPILVRAGSILPMAPDMEYSDQRKVDPLIVDVYAGKPATFRLYEDDGTSLDYRSGGYAWTPLVYTREDGGGQKIEIGPSEGKYRVRQKAGRYEVRVHGLLKPQSVNSRSPVGGKASRGLRWRMHGMGMGRSRRKWPLSGWPTRHQWLRKSALN